MSEEEKPKTIAERFDEFREELVKTRQRGSIDELFGRFANQVRELSGAVDSFSQGVTDADAGYFPQSKDEAYRMGFHAAAYVNQQYLRVSR